MFFFLKRDLHHIQAIKIKGEDKNLNWAARDRSQITYRKTKREITADFWKKLSKPTAIRMTALHF